MASRFPPASTHAGRRPSGALAGVPPPSRTTVAAHLSPSLRNTWVDRVAHDLRGPLAPMQTATYLLRDPEIDAAQRDELLDLLEQQIRRLSQMIGEVSDFGRAEAGRLVTRRERVEVESLVADLAGSLHTPPRIELDASAHGVLLEGDILRIAQMFQLLLGMRLARGVPAPVAARLESGRGRLSMRCTVACPEASDELVDLLLAAPHPDPPDDTLGFGLVIAGAIAAAHGGRLHGHASDGEHVELVLELPCVRPPTGRGANA